MPATVTLPLADHLRRSDITAAIQAHAQACWPRECCGVVTSGGFVALENVHARPTEAFDCCADLAPFLEDGTALALVHSHPTPDGLSRTAQDWPSADDMRGQISMDLPWGLLTCRADSASQPWYWGDPLPRPSLVGRLFRHGPSGTDGRGDCYALIRDWYARERGIDLPDFPREWEWWTDPADGAEHDLYQAHFRDAGFQPITPGQVARGDVALIIIPTLQNRPQNGVITTRPTHAGVYCGAGLVAHHLVGFRSTIEPLGSWQRLVKQWVRHVPAR